MCCLVKRNIHGRRYNTIVTISGDDMTPPCGDGAAGHESDHSGHVTVGVDRDDDGSRASDQLGGAEREDGVCGGEGEGGGDRDADEIVELRRALEYLVSDADDGRRRGSIDQEVSSRQPNGAAAKVVLPDREKTQHEQQRYMIPNLVNRVLVEHYSTNYRRETSQDSVAHARNMTIQQKETLTTLLLAVIVEYAEPHFVRVTLHRERERKKLLLSQQKKTQQDKKKMPNAPRSTAGNAHCCAEEYSDFDDRAVSWATTCIHQLIKPPALSSPKIGNESDDSYRSGDGYNIPALDALLAASGPHDGMALEKRMQSALMDGLQGRRLLQIIGLSTQDRDS